MSTVEGGIPPLLAAVPVAYQVGTAMHNARIKMMYGDKKPAPAPGTVMGDAMQQPIYRQPLPEVYRGPPTKQATNMIKPIMIGVVIIVVIFMIYMMVVASKPASKYPSAWSSFTPERSTRHVSDRSQQLFGIIPLKPL
jgi:hypothetical protein